MKTPEERVASILAKLEKEKQRLAEEVEQRPVEYVEKQISYPGERITPFPGQVDRENKPGSKTKKKGLRYLGFGGAAGLVAALLTFVILPKAGGPINMNSYQEADKQAPSAIYGEADKGKEDHMMVEEAEEDARSEENLAAEAFEGEESAMTALEKNVAENAERKMDDYSLDFAISVDVEAVEGKEVGREEKWVNKEFSGRKMLILYSEADLFDREAISNKEGAQTLMLGGEPIILGTFNGTVGWFYRRDGISYIGSGEHLTLEEVKSFLEDYFDMSF